VAVTDHEGPETVPLGDPLRSPTFVVIGDPGYFFQTFVPAGSPNVGVNPGFAWNHGGVALEINTTLLARAGPDVQNKGVTNSVWSDHTDIRPTLLGLLGLRDESGPGPRACGGLAALGFA
jgi:hypothetical protein